MKIDAYLFFNGRCEEAVKFYERALGAEVQMLMRNRESPEPAPPGMLPPGSEDKVMHASLKIGDSILMASDGHCSGVTEFKGFSLSITAADAGAAERMFNALAADGGRVDMPLAKTFWAELFGMVTDRFGVQWMVGLDH
jgi:PhnB protein